MNVSISRCLILSLLLAGAVVAANLFTTWKKSNEEAVVFAGNSPHVEGEGDSTKERTLTDRFVHWTQDQFSTHGNRSPEPSGQSRSVAAVPSQVIPPLVSQGAIWDAHSPQRVVNSTHGYRSAANEQAVPPGGTESPIPSIGATILPSGGNSPNAGYGLSHSTMASASPQNQIAETSPASPSQSPGSAKSAPLAVAENIPVAFADPQVLGNLSQGQQEQIAQIANDFTAAVQSSGVSPYSPQYSRTWNAAVTEANDTLRGELGMEAFNAMELSLPLQSTQN